MSDPHAIVFPGDIRHPDHEDWLLELGRVTYQAARVAGIAFDLLRVFENIDSAVMYDDIIGKLIKRLRKLEKTRPDLPRLREFIEAMEKADKVRNDVIHALPVQNGLHRRKTKDLHRVRNFFTVEDLRDAVKVLENTSRAGAELLYHDNGASIKAWYKRPEAPRR